MAQRFGVVSFVAGVLAAGAAFVALQAWDPPMFILEHLGATAERFPKPESPRALLAIREARTDSEWAKAAAQAAATDEAAKAGSVAPSTESGDPALVGPERVAIERFAAPYVGGHPLPSDSELLYGRISTNPPRWRTYVVARGAITGDTDVVAARLLPKTGDDGRSAIEIALNSAATKRLAEHTTANQGKQLAVVVDGTVMAAPTIGEPIANGKLELVVGTYDEARRMAGRLGGAPQPPPIYVVQAARLAPALLAGVAVLVVIFFIIRR